MMRREETTTLQDRYVRVDSINTRYRIQGAGSALSC